MISVFVFYFLSIKKVFKTRKPVDVFILRPWKGIVPPNKYKKKDTKAVPAIKAKQKIL